MTASIRAAERLRLWIGFCRGAALALVAIPVALGCGCTKHETPGPRDEVTLTARSEDGSVEVTLSLNPSSPTTETPAELRLRVLADKGVTVDVDDYQRNLENTERHFEYRFESIERRASVPVSDGKLEWLARFRVEFVLVGEYELPPAKVSFAPAARADDPSLAVPSGPSSQTDAMTTPPGRSESTTLATPPLRVLVTEGSGTPLSPDELRNLHMPSPVDLPRRWGRFWPWYAAIGAGTALAIVTLLLTRRGRRGAAEVVVPAHEWAQRMFATLIADDLLARNRVQEFFYRVSAIVRGYIERRFDVAAPEMTTEEFLTAVSTNARFPRDCTNPMEQFLRTCDLVKYAKHLPQPQDAKNVLSAAQNFVEETQLRGQVAPTSTTAPNLGGGHR